MDLSRSETKVHNEVPVPETRILDIKGAMRSTTRLMQLFKLCCNVCCELAEWFICFTKLYTNEEQ